MNKRFLGFQLFEWVVFGLALLILTLFLHPEILSRFKQSTGAVLGFSFTLDHLLYIGLYTLFIAPMLICVYAYSLGWGSSVLAIIARVFACIFTVLLMVFMGLLFQSL